MPDDEFCYFMEVNADQMKGTVSYIIHQVHIEEAEFFQRYHPRATRIYSIDHLMSIWGRLTPFLYFCAYKENQ